MIITSIKMRKINKSGKLKAVSSITMDGLLVVHNIKVIDRDGNGSQIITMPNRKDNRGSYKDIAHPIIASSRAYFEKTILEVFNDLIVSDDNSTEVKTTDEYDFFSEKQSISIISNKKTFTITSITLRKLDSNNRCRGIVSVVLDNEFAIHDIKLIVGDDAARKYLGMPSEKKGESWSDIVHPIIPDLRNKLEEIIFALYNQLEQEEASTFFYIGNNLKDSVFNQTSQDFELSHSVPIQVNQDNYDSEKQQKKTLLQPKDEIKPEDPIIPFNKDNIEIIEMSQNSALKFYKGCIIGFFKRNYYLLRMESNCTGIIEREEFDILYKVINYKKNIYKEFSANTDNSDDLELTIQQYIDKYFYFEKTELIEGSIPIYSICNVKKIYLNNIINSGSITNGKIIDINNEYTIILLDYGWVFITKTYRILYPSINPDFDLSKFKNSDISIRIIYDREKNILYPSIANIYSYWTKNNMFVFPVFNNFDGILESRLALDRNLRFVDRHDKFVSKRLGQNFIIKKLRLQNEANRYKANIVKILSKDMDFILKQSLCLIEINNLIGYNLNDAINYLQKNHILYSFSYEYSWEVEEDIVFKMTPIINEAAVVPHNIVVQLTASKGSRKEYIVPSYVGRKIDEVVRELKEHNLKYKYVVHDNPIPDIMEDSYITGSRPDEGTRLFSYNSITLYLYKKQTNNSPFRIFENEVLQFSTSSKVIGTESDYLFLSNAKWKEKLVELILKHKSITTYHIKIFLCDIYCYNISESEIDDVLDFLLKKSFICGVTTKANNLFSAKQRYLYPLNKLYYVCKNNYISTGKFYIKNWQATNFKVRASENQAFIKLIQATRQKYSLEYFVDKIQNYSTQDTEKAIRIHFWINLFNEFEKKVFIIESIRFFEFDTDSDLGTKFLRYSELFSEQYDITPSIIMVFEDNVHAKFFLDSYNHVFSKSKYNVLYTYDELTNSSEENFDKIFLDIKEEAK